jgi:HlyD family secretion protein
VQGGGRLEHTLLLTGQTGPEKYSSLLTPQLRGGRGQQGTNDGSSFTTRERGGRNSGSGAGGGSGSSGSTSSPTTGSTSAAAGAVVSTSSSSSSAGPSSGMSAGMRSSTSRIGGSSASARPTTPAASASTSTMGDSGIGSSAASLPGQGGPGGGGGGNAGGGGGGARGGGGGGGGGGGMTAFMLVLQEAAKAGARVKKGDVVAEFDRQYMLQRLDDFRATVAQADSSYKKLLAQIEVNKKAHDQTIGSAVAAVDKAKLDMKTLPVLSAMDSERRKLALEEAEARLKQLREEVKFVDIGLAADKRTADLELQQSRIELKRAEMNADRMIMKAPIDGLVVMMNTFRGSEFDQIKVGDQLMPGMMFMQIVDPASMVINATVNQADVERLRLGQKAHVKFDAFPGLELPAHLAAIGSVARASRFRPDYVKEMAVVLKLDHMDPRVIPDLSVSCNMVLKADDVPALIPREGIFQDEKDSKPYAFVRGENGNWQRRDVETGLASNTHIAVKSGLRAGDVIALDRPPTPGAKPESVSEIPAPARRKRDDV